MIREGSTDNIRAAQHSLHVRRAAGGRRMSVFSLCAQFCPVQMPAKGNREGIEAMLWGKCKPFTAAAKLLQALAVSCLHTGQ